MKRYLKLVGGVFAALLAIYLLFEVLGVPLFQDATVLLGERGISAAAIGVGLLIVDMFVPVPSSLVMVAQGALFGVGMGTLLSMVGQMGAVLLGFAVGRAGGPVMERLVPPDEKARADRFVARWGALAIVISRPVPLFAETVVILAGASPMGWGRATLAGAAGALPPALLYALTGAVASDFGSAALMFGFVLLITGLFWLVGRRMAGNADDPGSAGNPPESGEPGHVTH